MLLYYIKNQAARIIAFT